MENILFLSMTEEEAIRFVCYSLLNELDTRVRVYVYEKRKWTRCRSFKEPLTGTCLSNLKH